MAELRMRSGRGAEDEWLTRMARAGYTAKGIVYLIIGGMAGQAAWYRRSAGGSQDALTAFLGQPFGRALLAVMAVGLLGYVGWRAYAAIANPENESGWKRAFAGVVAFVYGGLTLQAARLALGVGSGGAGGEGQASDWTARLMAQPFGVWLVGLVGLGIGAYGLYGLKDAWDSDLDDQLDLSSVTDTQRRWIRGICRTGIAARGIVFLMIGWFLITAARQSDASEAVGLQGALNSLRDEPFGPWLLTAAGVGLAAYGAYNLVRARYRVIRTS